MEFWDVVTSRHAIRDFRPEPVPAQKIERLMDAVAAAPSAMNEQPGRFYIVRGGAREDMGGIIAGATVHLQEYMEQLGPQRYEDAVKWFSTLGDAPVLIAVAMEKPVSDIDNINKLLSVGASIENLLLAATAEGLAACNVTFTAWVEEELVDFLGLDQESVVVAVIALGYAGDVPPVAPKHRRDIAKWIG